MRKRNSPMLQNDTLARSIAGLAVYARRRGLTLSSAEVVDGMKACGELIPRTLPELRDTLKPCFVKSFDDLVLFDDVFHAYFHEEKVAALSAVVGTRVRLQAAGQKAAEGNAENTGREKTTPAWQTALGSDPGLPRSFQAFLEGDPHAAAARLMREPLTEADKKEIVNAASRIAGRITAADLPRIRGTLHGYVQLAGEVERLRANRSTDHPVHTRHGQRHTWSSPAYFAADQAPRELLDARLAAVDKDRLARLITEAQAAAMALKPFFARNPGSGLKRYALDYRRTVRESLDTFGEPMKLLYSARHRRLRRLVTFCDVSGSVKKATGVLLAFLYGLHQAFEGRARHFLFVSEVDEVTPYFVLPSYDECYRQLSSASAVDFRGYSNYGKALSLLWENYRSAFDYETVFFFLGDARTNKYDPRPDLLRDIRARVRNTFFLNPEEPGKWGTADSAVNVYRSDVEVIDISTFGNLIRFLNRLPGLVVAR